MKREDIFREIRMGIYWIMSDGLNDDQERECDKILSNLKFIEPSGHFIGTKEGPMHELTKAGYEFWREWTDDASNGNKGLAAKYNREEICNLLTDKDNCYIL